MEMTHEKITIHATGSRAAEALKTAFLTQATVSFGPVTFVVTELADGLNGGASARLTEMRLLGWTGEGLPPVGTVCEVDHPDIVGKWCACTILEWDAGCAVFRAGGQYPYLYDGRKAGYFRPIRTPEQIAADKRLHEIRNALTAINSKVHFPNDPVRGNILAAAVEAMVDAGYRKQVAE